MVHNYHTIFKYTCLNTPFTNTAYRSHIMIQYVLHQSSARLNNRIHFFVSLFIRNMWYIFCSIRSTDLNTERIHCTHTRLVFCVHFLSQLQFLIFCNTTSPMIYIGSNFFSVLIPTECFSLCNNRLTIMVWLLLTFLSLNSKTILRQKISGTMKQHTSFTYP